MLEPPPSKPPGAASGVMPGFGVAHRKQACRGGRRESASADEAKAGRRAAARRTIRRARRWPGSWGTSSRPAAPAAAALEATVIDRTWTPPLPPRRPGFSVHALVKASHCRNGGRFLSTGAASGRGQLKGGPRVPVRLTLTGTARRDLQLSAELVLVAEVG